MFRSVVILSTMIALAVIAALAAVLVTELTHQPAPPLGTGDEQAPPPPSQVQNDHQAPRYRLPGIALVDQATSLIILDLDQLTPRRARALMQLTMGGAAPALDQHLDRYERIHRELTSHGARWMTIAFFEAEGSDDSLPVIALDGTGTDNAAVFQHLAELLEQIGPYRLLVHEQSPERRIILAIPDPHEPDDVPLTPRDLDPPRRQQLLNRFTDAPALLVSSDVPSLLSRLSPDLADSPIPDLLAPPVHIIGDDLVLQLNRSDGAPASLIWPTRQQTQLASLLRHLADTNQHLRQRVRERQEAGGLSIAQPYDDFRSDTWLLIAAAVAREQRVADANLVRLNLSTPALREIAGLLMLLELTPPPASTATSPDDPGPDTSPDPMPDPDN